MVPDQRCDVAHPIKCHVQRRQNSPVLYGYVLTMLGDLQQTLLVEARVITILDTLLDHVKPLDQKVAEFRHNARDECALSMTDLLGLLICILALHGGALARDWQA